MRMLTLIALTIMAGCASQEPAKESLKPAQVATHPAPAAAPVALADEKTSKFKVPPGYRPRGKGDAMVYCRKDVMLGSRFPTESCYTKEQIAELEANAAASRREMQKGQICGASTSQCVSQ
jgi:hypothetical protein